MGFPQLDVAEAAEVAGEGKKLSKAQCAYIYTLSFTSAVVSCGGTPTDYLKLYNSSCK
ncbi:hypothetical protein [Streptomyces sp. SID13588]|nr:hypothetical protein [Streptomyces sp. SID13588]